MKKKTIAILLGILLLVPVIAYAAFPDVGANHWAASYINELTSKGVIDGYTDGTYKPNNTLTKGEFLKLIMTASLPNLDFSKAIPKFKHWAAGYVTVAENYGVVKKGEINYKNINEPINRIDVVRILSSCDINIRKNLQQRDGILTFNDISGLTVLEELMLNHAVEIEVINGYEDGSFKPERNLTRAEVAKILSTYIAKGDEKK